MSTNLTDFDRAMNDLTHDHCEETDRMAIHKECFPVLLRNRETLQMGVRFYTPPPSKKHPIFIPFGATGLTHTHGISTQDRVEHETCREALHYDTKRGRGEIAYVYEYWEHLALLAHDGVMHKLL